MKAATVSKLSGDAYVERGGERIALEQGSELSQSDVISTGADSKIELRFMDDSIIELGPATQVDIQDFAFDPAGQGEPSFALHMMGGVVRSISGKIVEQNPESFKLTSPLGAVGIRGTETLHVIGQGSESHAVINLGYGHTVLITGANGQSVLLTQSLTGVGISPGGIEQTPLTPEIINQFLQQVSQGDGVASGGSDASAGRGFYVVADSAVLAGMDVPTVTENVAVVSAEELPALLAALEESLEIAAEVTGEVLADLMPGQGGNVFMAESNDLPADPSGPGPSEPSQVDPPPAPAVTPTEGADNITLPGLSPVTLEGLGGNDSIIIEGPQNGFAIYGDWKDFGGNVIGGNDTIMVTPGGLYATSDMTAGNIYGDGAAIAGSSKGGNDSIIVQGNVSGGTIYGDAREMSGAGEAGKDSIIIEGTLSGSAAIYGDAHSIGGGAWAASDSITVASMTGGTIYGDAHTMDGGAKTASDSITVVSMSGGTIYGDAANVPTWWTSASANEISIGSMTGGTIYASDTSRSGGDGSAISINSFGGGDIYMSGSSSLNMDSITTEGVKNIYFGNGTDTIIFGALNAGPTDTVTINAKDAGVSDIITFSSDYDTCMWEPLAAGPGSILTLSNAAGGTLQILFDSAVNGTINDTGGGWQITLGS